MNTKKALEIRLLKIILWVYIILCFVIAGLNYGYASHAPASIAAYITWFWAFYENWIKTLFIILGSVLTLRIVSTSGRTTMRKRNLMGFITTALIIHIVSPLVLHNSELYYFAMPIPWGTVPLQLFDSSSTFYLSSLSLWGLTGITTALIFYIFISAIVFLGTLLFGRRWQCSTLCLFNGFASEVFSPVFPLVGKHKKAGTNTLKVFSMVKWLFLAISLFFTFYWVFLLLGLPIEGDPQLISKIESYKYLSTELLITMFFWIAFIGRGYCYYCPLGTTLGLLGKVAGQKIDTDNTQCLQCNQCNIVCPMSIDIKSMAQKGQPVTSLRCVGCGHCVDACSSSTLSYTTSFMTMMTRNKLTGQSQAATEIVGNTKGLSQNRN
ncbi:MAG TPA: 4Fe-4S dicluster domain-containing protein [Desulfosporosinus sp.]|nr:4Fe-4S dicluster domain-containing protein [Desulfosporosinus sp.]